MILNILLFVVIASQPMLDIPPPDVPAYQAPPIASYQAKTLREYAAPEADQGVALDDDYFYAVDNTVIGKFERDTGELIERWIGPEDGAIRHMNSCYAKDDKLWCANSNYSQTPMASSIEIFSTSTLEHIDTHSLGLMDEGSLTWFDDVPEGRIAGFAHYDEKGGLSFKGAEFSGVVLFDREWRRMGGWMFPKSVTERMAPYAASGGAVGPDGYLYVMGHDLPEMYVLGKPKMGPTLVHIATISVEAEGQAFSWDTNGQRRMGVIDRRRGRVRILEIPTVSAPADVKPFRL